MKPTASAIHGATCGGDQEHTPIPPIAESGQRRRCPSLVLLSPNRAEGMNTAEHLAVSLSGWA